MSQIFLSYVHADSTEALNLFDDISAAGYPVWLDQKALLVGQKWKDEIARAIQAASAFIALISKNSVDHQGYVQKELKQGLEVLAETPSNQIYLLPVRLNDARPHDIQLQDLHWLDLFPDRSSRVPALLDALATIPDLRAATRKVGASTSPPVPKFTSMADIFPLVLRGIPPSTPNTGAANAFYVTARTTTEDGLGLPKELLAKYPNEITFVLQHQYRDLACGDASFSVTLSFSGKDLRVTVPYSAIVAFEEREAHIRIA